MSDHYRLCTDEEINRILKANTDLSSTELERFRQLLGYLLIPEKSIKQLAEPRTRKQ